MSEHDNLPYIKHILDAINDIENSVTMSSKREFEEAKDIKDATIRRVEVIGEAVKNISQKTKDSYPNVAWKKIAGARDRMIHAYFSVDLNIVWEIIQKDLPILKKQIQKIKEDLEKKNETRK